jgi:indolepyruvate ferredoxin oxidoreductase alpha subunit
MAHGMRKAGEPRKVVGVVGDSTFFHSGITGLLDIGYNQGAPVIMVLDNRTTAMTGHQEHPGTGQTIRGQPTIEARIDEFGKSCGIRNIAVVDPWKIKQTVGALREALDSGEGWLIIARGECPLATRKPRGGPRRVEQSLCTVCKACLKLGCPAIEFDGEQVRINELLCGGCSLCQQVCARKAIKPAAEGSHGST